jgi:ABC-2 type transport system ATP-binding protein
MPLNLELRGVRKAFDDFVAVDGVSLRVPEGTVFGLLGPNGAGKTTTIRMIMNIIAPDSGEVLFFERPRQEADMHRIGYLPEERGLYRKMTVAEHLLYFGELHGLKRAELRPRVDRWLERMELTQWAHRKVEELSKGMQQKIQLAGTLIHDPQIVILDEPFSGLDPINQQLFKDLLAEYKAAGKSILFSTHVMEQAEKLCDHVCLIFRGKAILDGELKAIKQQWGGNSYKLVAEGDPERLRRIPGVESIVVRDGSVKLLLDRGTQGPEVLKDIVGVMRVQEFRSEEPELEEIFIKAVQDAR